ncbi:RNA polymerase sigma factor [Variovorax sp. LT1R16]|uniref:RNA polymerase sigma factor n=1 Tax=Variovorax sp. LT1R16 TaxID=3443728 RepID=UPI003F47CE80
MGANLQQQVNVSETHDRDLGIENSAAASTEENVDQSVVLREVLVSHYDSLCRKLARRLGCPDLATECLHDAWLRLGNATICVDVNCPDAYVYRVAHNVATDRLRDDRPWCYASAAEIALEGLVDHTPGPESIAQSRSALKALEHAFQRLPRRHKSVLMEIRVEERSRQDVAQHLGISLRTVDSVLRQALEFCSERTGHQVLAGVTSSRRKLTPRNSQPSRGTGVRGNDLTNEMATFSKQ